MAQAMRIGRPYTLFPQVSMVTKNIPATAVAREINIGVLRREDAGALLLNEQRTMLAEIGREIASIIVAAGRPVLLRHRGEASDTLDGTVLQTLTIGEDRTSPEALAVAVAICQEQGYDVITGGDPEVLRRMADRLGYQVKRKRRKR